MPLVIRMQKITDLSPTEQLDVVLICDREGIEDVEQVLDNKGGHYWQGKARGGVMQKFRIERKPDAENITP
jgi:hypothetical protein